VSKSQTSCQPPFSSQPPKIQATLSTTLTVCARQPREGMRPCTGATNQYMPVAGTSSACASCGMCGNRRNLCRPSCAPLASRSRSRSGAGEPGGGARRRRSIVPSDRFFRSESSDACSTSPRTAGISDALGVCDRSFGRRGPCGPGDRGGGPTPTPLAARDDGAESAGPPWNVDVDAVLSADPYGDRRSRAKPPSSS
jgi:hypothetical protein